MKDHPQINKVDISVCRHNMKDKFIMSKLANACRSVVKCSVGFKGRGRIFLSSFVDKKNWYSDVLRSWRN